MSRRHGVELLQGERVDPSEDGEVAFGGAEPGGLLVAVVGDGGWLFVLIGERRAVGAGQHRDALVGPVLGDELLRVEAEFAERAVDELLDPHPVLDAHHLVLVGAADDLVEPGRRRLRRVPGLRGAGLGLAAGLLGGVALRGGALPGALDAVGEDQRGLVHDPGDLRLPAQLLGALLRLGAGLPLVLGGALQRVGPTRDGLRLLLDAAQRQPGVHLGLPGAAGLSSQGVALGWVGFGEVVLGGGGLQAGGELREGRLIADPRGPRRLDGLGEPLRLPGGGRLALPVGVELVGDGRELGVGGVQLAERVLLGRAGVVQSGGDGAGLEPQPLRAAHGGLQRLLRLGELGLHLEQRRRRGGPGLHQPRRVQVTIGRDGDHVGMLGDDRGRLGGTVNGDDAGQQPVERARQPVWGSDEVTHRHPCRARVRRGRCPGHDERRAAQVGVGEEARGGERPVEAVDDDRLGHPAQRGRHDPLVARLDGDQVAQAPDDVVAARAEQVGGAVLDLAEQAQRLDPRLQRGTLPSGLRLACFHVGRLPLGLGDRVGGLLEEPVEVGLGGAEPGERGFGAVELPGRLVCAGERLVPAGAEPGDLLVGGLQA